MKIRKIIFTFLIVFLLVVFEKPVSELMFNENMYEIKGAEAWLWPVPGHKKLSQEYIYTDEYKHTAIDISDSSISGATVLAAMGGTVDQIFYCAEQHYGSFGDCYGFGTGMIILGTDGRYYIYAHMQGNSIPSNVYKGAKVEKGQTIGKVGTTGYSTGPHLHFGIAKNSANKWSGDTNPQLETYVDSLEVIPTSVSFDKSTATLTSKGATVTLSATVSPSNATNKSVTWSSSNTSVATVNSSGVVTAVGNGTATITVKTSSGAKTATCNVTVAIPTLNSDGWYYTSVLPSNITSSVYEIQYQNIYQKYATTSPGSGWTDTGVDKVEYVKSGSTYTSQLPLETSNTVRLDSYYYYHYCTSSSGIAANFYYSSVYGHYDAIWPSSSLYEYSSAVDTEDSRYTYYHLKWSDGSDLYCWRDSSSGTCDGTYGTHGSRSYYWYKMYVYQNYTATTLNQYQSTSAWTTTKDSSATTVKYRYRVKPTAVTLNKTTATLTSSGATVALTATVSPSGANTAVTWKSSNTSVATVNSSGVVTAVGNGTATITATTASGGKTASCTVTVNIVPTGVSLNHTSASYTSSGATLQLKATVSPSNAANKSVTWKSSNTSVATVDANGLVKTVGNGTATITATTASGGKTASCTVTVNIVPTGVSLNQTSASYISSGATLQLKATVSPSNAANKSVTWKSSNTSVATVDANGLVTTVGNGTATITATTVSGGKTASCTVTVNIAPTGVYLNHTNLNFTKVGENIQLTATVVPSNAVNKSVTWASSNTSVATVDANGVVTAVGAGTATITVTTVSGGKTFYCTVTVTITAPLSGLCKASDGNWYYYTDGVIDVSVTGLVKNEYGWWYVTSGKLNFDYTGMVKYKSNWVYVNKGKLDATYTGMAKNAYGWWYMKKGKLDTTYTGLVKYNSNWVYVNKGKLDATYTGMAKNQYGWWYVKKGKLDTTYTGMAKNSYGWWYMKNGKLDTTYSGKVNYNGVSYNVIKGKVEK